MIFAVGGLMVLSAPALSQQQQPPKTPPKEAPKEKGGIVEVRIPVAVLDVQVILRDASAVKNIRDQINKYGSKFEEEIEKERGEIRKANQELARQRTILAPDAFAEKRRKFEQRVVEVQRLVQQRQRELDKSRNESMLIVNRAYIEIVGALATERNLAVILRKDQTVFAVTSLDVTQEVLTRLNKKLPAVKVNKPGAEPAKPSAPAADKTSSKAKPGK